MAIFKVIKTLKITPPVSGIRKFPEFCAHFNFSAKNLKNPENPGFLGFPGPRVPKTDILLFAYLGNR